MSSTFAPPVPAIAAGDPTKHVNYVAGMVLGVDDFTQEFAYLSGHDARIVRDLIGYGVVSGLHVSVDVDATQGPRVQVAPGEAVTPSGKLVAVCPAQCATLQDWLDANATKVEAITSPPSTLPVYVVLCHRECPTDDVPIPGEPCRSDDELKQPSRLKESFSLELRLDPPHQWEETAVREFVRWARRIPVVDSPGAGLDAFLVSLRTALGLDSPPSSPMDEIDLLLEDLLDSPPPGLEIPSGDAAAYLSELLRFWVEELRPWLRSPHPGCECGCAGGPGELDPDADCVLLAALEVPVDVDGVTGNLLVADTPAVAIDTSGRPTLLHLRLLQEWIFAPGGALSVSGVVNADGSIAAATEGLSAQALSDILFRLDFSGFDPALQHVVLGQPIGAYNDKSPSTFEVIPAADPDLVADLGGPPGPGLVVRVQTSKGKQVPGGFSVRIEQLGGGS